MENGFSYFLSSAKIKLKIKSITISVSIITKTLRIHTQGLALAFLKRGGHVHGNAADQWTGVKGRCGRRIL